MTEIHMPDVLDPPELGFIDTIDGIKAHQREIADALKRVCAYSETLWHVLERSRAYLMENVARGHSGGAPIVGESGTLLRTEDHWEVWARRYAAVHSVLCGPQGDEDLGKTEARHEAQVHGHLSASP